MYMFGVVLKLLLLLYPKTLYIQCDTTTDSYSDYYFDNYYSTSSNNNEINSLDTEITSTTDFSTTTEIISTTKIERCDDTTLEITDLTYDINKENILFLNWNIPDICKDNNTSYKIFDKYDNSTSTTEKNTYQIQLKCQNYNFKITPLRIDGALEGKPDEVEIPSAGIPDLVLLKVTDSSVLFNISVPSNNRCPILNVTVKYNNRTETIKIGDSNSILIDNLDKLSNYTFQVKVQNALGSSEWSEPMNVSTPDDVPSKPKNVKIFDVSSTALSVKWEEPDTINGLHHYIVMLEDQGPQHPIGPDCKNTTNITKNVDKGSNSITFKKLQPDFKYSITVQAVNKNNEGGISKSTEITTKTATPNEVPFINVTDVVFNDNNTYNLTISWKAPCNSNGKIKEFLIIIEGDYFDGSMSLPDNMKISDKDTDITKLHYYTYTNAKPAYSYKINIIAVLEDGTKGKDHQKDFLTPDGIPNPPSVTELETTSSSIKLFWTESPIKFGKITQYNIRILSKGSVSPIESCKYDTETYVYNVPGDTTTFSFDKAKPYYSYNIEMSAQTAVGVSKIQGNTTSTKTAKPLPSKFTLDYKYPQTEEYKGEVIITVEKNCDLNGKFKEYRLSYTAIRGNDKHSSSFTFPEDKNQMPLSPDTDYAIDIYVSNQDFESERESKKFHSKAGVPTIEESKLESPSIISTTTVNFTLTENIFGNDNGDILYYALFILPRTNKLSSKAFGFWKNSNESWPSVPETLNKEFEPYQITEIFWQPFKDGRKTVEFKIGTEENCLNKKYCNKLLEEDTEYSLVVRALTSDTYRDSSPIQFKTADVVNLTLILGLSLGIPFFFIFSGIIAFFYYRRQKQMRKRASSVIDVLSTDEPVPISIKKFPQYYQYLSQNRHILKAQFAVLFEKSKVIKDAMTTEFATLPENRRKNRYTNILPYDSTRVKLIIDEDDEIGNDYINASYIYGYSQKIEYIATQGPLENTCRDFWKMILQENITVIVMVTQCVEQGKEKCYKYYPNNKETITLDENFKVDCISQLDFGTYCVRTLLVKKDNHELTVSHLMFMDWPDFDVPLQTRQMIEFCEFVREKAVASNNNKIVVHCSAGVGRTGTLIAIDILMQKIQRGEDIDVFSCVLELRKQRVNMVQTENQYLFIHSCIKDAIENTSEKKSISNIEAIYENVAAIKSSEMVECSL